MEKKYKINVPYLFAPIGLIFVLFLYSLFLPLLVLLLGAGLAIAYKYYFYEVVILDSSIMINSGFILRQKREILFSKINDIQYTENLAQRFFRTGSIIIQTGNDSPTIISSMDEYENLVEQIKTKIKSH